MRQAVNEAAAQAALVNNDRCTKNFFLFRDPNTLAWARAPWDVEQSMPW